MGMGMGMGKGRGRGSSGSGVAAAAVCRECTLERVGGALRRRAEARGGGDEDGVRSNPRRMPLAGGWGKGTPCGQLSRLRSEAAVLRSRVEGLRRSCGTVSAAAATLAARNGARAEALRDEGTRTERARGGLDVLWCGVLGGDGDGDGDGSGDGNLGGEMGGEAATEAPPEFGLPEALSSLVSEAQRLRLVLALRAFESHRLDVCPEHGEERRDGNEDEASLGSKEGGAAASSPSSAGAEAERRHRRRPRGVGKVGGLPLPHAGPALYGVLPPAVLASALRLTAGLTGTVARCLAVDLPHPVLLRAVPPGAGRAAVGAWERSRCGDIAEAVELTAAALADPLALDLGLEFQGRQSPVPTGTPRGVEGHRSPLCGDSGASAPGRPRDDGPDAAAASSRSGGLLSLSSAGAGVAAAGVGSIRSLAGRSAKKALAMATAATAAATTAPLATAPSPSSSGGSSSAARSPPAHLSRASGATSVASADAEPSTSAKIRHACAAVVAEGTGGEGKAFALLPAGLSATHTHGLVPADGDEFATGLQLLQNDVVSLCIAAGVPVADMWPAEALLLNLNALRVHLVQELEQSQNGNKIQTRLQ